MRNLRLITPSALDNIVRGEQSKTILSKPTFLSTSFELQVSRLPRQRKKELHLLETPTPAVDSRLSAEP